MCSTSSLVLAKDAAALNVLMDDDIVAARLVARDGQVARPGRSTPWTSFPHDSQSDHFVLAIYVGYHVVRTVTPALHTPLMAVTNAIRPSSSSARCWRRR